MASNRLSDQTAWDFFYDLFGGNEYACAGACGNMMWESGLYSDNCENSWNSKTGISDEQATRNCNDGTWDLNYFLYDNTTPSTRSKWWVNPIGFGYGLSQWTSVDRRTKLWNRTIAQGIDIDNQQAQLDYIRWEFENGWSTVRTQLMRATSVYEATKIYCNGYEGGAWTSTRQTYAQDFYDRFAGTGSGYTINIIIDGNGDAFANMHLQDLTNRIYRAEAGEDVFIHAIAGAGDYFLLWTSDYGGAVIDVDTNLNTFFTMPASRVDITAHFTGETPEPPTPPEPPPYIGRYKKHHMPIWEYPMFRV